MNLITYCCNCPKYISKDQMIALINLVRNDKIDDETKLKFECIYRLLYEAGLRIGEVLGLTLEDFKIIQDKSNNDICEHDAPTDELFCAYGLCQNQCHFFYNIPYYLSRFNDGKEIIDMNLKMKCKQQAQKELYKIQHIINYYLKWMN